MSSIFHLFEFPTSALLAVSFLLIVFAIHRYAHSNVIVRFFSSIRVAGILLAVGAIMLAIEGTWAINIHGSVIFVVYALFLLFSLALAILDSFRVEYVKFAFLPMHVGIFFIIFGALFGAPDVKRGKMVIGKEAPVNQVYTDDGKLMTLPFELKLEDFTIDYYDDGVSPKQFTSKLLLFNKIKTEVSVNHPMNYSGYYLYQNSYDPETMQYTVLEVVHDPWIYIIYTGMALLALGSFIILYSKWKAKYVIPITVVLTILFTYFTIAKINFGTLMPALRSWWFVPHLFFYMVAYSLMAFALVVWLIAAFRKKDHLITLSNNLVRSSSALLIIGMLTGSVWAKQAWGDYWAWDPKENWAAVTWFIALIHLHLQNKRSWRALAIIILAFLALQITWYGVNYLPSAMNSMHTYTS